ncbi:riboflavin synthase, partial [Francisella tularensis subsp. holarctica]|nr:riboflavin synthase [Francisella tularensis subsp. holarctica]
MFSGIFQQLGTIKKITTKDSLKYFCIKFDNIIQCCIGDSVAIIGTCLTV